MSWVLPRTEKTSNSRVPSPARGTFASQFATGVKPSRSTCVKFTQLFSRIACGLLAALHITPLLRVSRNIMEQGPTPALIATWAVLVLLIGVLAAKAAGVVFFRAGSRRASTVALILACALFHGDVIISKDAAPTTIAVLTVAGGAIGAAHLGRKLQEHFAGRGT